MHHMLLSSSIHLLWLAAQNVAVKQLLLICGHWAVPAPRRMFFFPTSYRFPANFKLLHWVYIYLLPLNMTLYIYIHISVCVLKHISPVLTPKYILSSYTKDWFQALGMGALQCLTGHQKRRGAMVFPEDETLASLDFLQSDLHLSWRRMMKFTSIGTIKNTENISHDLRLKGWWLKKQRTTYVNKFELTYLNSHWMRTPVSLRRPARLWLKPLQAIPLLSRLCTLIYPWRSHQQLPKKSAKSTVCQWLEYFCIFLFWTF